MCRTEKVRYLDDRPQSDSRTKNIFYHLNRFRTKLKQEIKLLMYKQKLLETAFKVGICVSSGGYCKTGFTLSLASLTPYLSHQKVHTDLAEQSFSIRITESSSIPNNRHWLVNDVIKDDYTHVCFIDDDISFPNYAIHKLASWRKPVVGVNYRKRSKKENGFSASKRWDESETGFKQVNTTEKTHFLEEVTGLGFGLCLIETEVFKTIPEPWFEFRWDDELKLYMGEDIAFCKLCNEHNIPLYIDHDLSREIAHVGTYPYMWNDHFSTQ